MRRINIDGFEMEIEGEEPIGPCAMCRSDASTTLVGLRPYGLHNAEICYLCAALNPKRTKRQILRFLLEKKLVPPPQLTEIE